MTIDINNFKKVPYKGGKCIYFDKKYSFHKHFGHKKKTKRFLYHKTLLDFLDENPLATIYFTLDDTIPNFKKYDNNFLINADSYIEFCNSLASNTKGRARAFLGQHLKVCDIFFTDEEKTDFFKKNSTEENLIASIKNLDSPTQRRITRALNISKDNASNTQSANISKDDFIKSFTKFLADEEVQSAFLKNLPGVQIETLKSHLLFLEKNLDKGETFFQNWIDEDDRKYSKQRCLIFGLEYIDPKREGKVNEKRFDILAEQNREHHVLIELKSPTAEIFSVRKKTNKNGGKSTEYEISPVLARAIPQILSYKKWYEDASAEEIQSLGLMNKKSVSKCIIIIGKSLNDVVWKENFDRLKASFNIEILTYTDLIDKLKNSIKNLEENL